MISYLDWLKIPALTILIGMCIVGHSRSEPASFDPRDSWEFQYRNNDFNSSALLDLRPLNETVAGERGFVRLTPDGTGLVFGDGKPARFWGTIFIPGEQSSSVIPDPAKKASDADLEEHSKWLAKLGVNMTRRMFLGVPMNPGSTPDDVNQAEIDAVWRYVATMKKRGIYTSLITTATLVDYGKADIRKWGVAGYEVDYTKNPKITAPWGVEYFNPVLQHSYKARLKALLGQVNPYTGMKLADDPSILMIQLVSEDGLLFYTFDGMKPEQLRELGKLFGDWLKSKYGSIEQAMKEAWSPPSKRTEGIHLLSPDLPAEGIVGFFHAWEATQPQISGTGKAKRLADQVEFLCATERKFNEEIIRYLREDLKCKQLILPGNWRPANPVTMQDAQRWCYLPGQVIAENHFLVRGHDTWRTVQGDIFGQPTALKPLELEDAPPYVFKQVDGHATILTSTGWIQPNIHQAESAFLCATYGSLAGLSGICWDGFSQSTEYDQTVVLKPNPTTKWFMTWNTARPAAVSGFPAAALMYRLGYLARGETVVHERRPLSDMWERKMPLIADHGSYRELTAEMQNGRVDPLAFFVGPVRVEYGGDPAKNTVADLSKFILRDQEKVRSNTGQIELQYGKGICTVNAPKAQGVCGFLGQTGTFTLSTVTITSTNSYASILVVPMDDRPLSESQKVLVQVATTARPSGWKSEPAELKLSGMKTPVSGERLLDAGSAPFRVAATHATVTIANPYLTKATLLDASGMAVEDVPVTRTNRKCMVTLPPQTMFLVLTK
jgi:hypothetical protein